MYIAQIVYFYKQMAPDKKTFTSENCVLRRKGKVMAESEKYLYICNNFSAAINSSNKLLNIFLKQYI